MERITSIFRKNILTQPTVFLFPAGQMNKIRKCLVSVPTRNYHGHNYELVVKVTGVPDPQTGYVINLSDLSSIIQQHVLAKFDHKNLNLDTKDLSIKTRPPRISYMLFMRSFEKNWIIQWICQCVYTRRREILWNTRDELNA